MTFAAVQQQLVDIVLETSSALLLNVGEFGRFTHDKGIGRSDRGGRTRSFNVISPSAAKSSLRNGRIFQDFDLLIDYVHYDDQFLLDQVMHSDADELSQRLSLPSNWEQATSTICVLLPVGDELFPYTIETVDGESGPAFHRLTMTFTADHTGQTIP